MTRLIILFVVAAVVSYFVSGLNPAIILSQMIYHEDIRNNKSGSGNPGFTNFKRVYGSKYAYLVMVLDIGKGVLLMTIFGILFKKCPVPEEMSGMDIRLIGVTFTALFASIGHDFPLYYKGKGGKGFLVNIAALWFYDWRVGLVGVVLLCLILFTTHYMSLATMVAIGMAPVVMLFIGQETVAVMIAGASALLMAFRHKENIKRLVNGTEKKFYLKK